MLFYVGIILRQLLPCTAFIPGHLVHVYDGGYSGPVISSFLSLGFIQTMPCSRKTYEYSIHCLHPAVDHVTLNEDVITFVTPCRHLRKHTSIP